MQLTNQQKKFIWVAAAVVAAIYIGPHFVQTVHRAVSGRQTNAIYAAHNKPSPAVRQMPSQAIASTPKLLKNPDDASRLVGNWLGGGLIAERGFCRLGFEIKFDDSQEGYYRGYSTLSCGPSLPFNGKKPTAENRAANTINQLAPVSAILSGTVVKGAIDFEVYQDFGGSPDGPCPWTHAKVTDFGDENIAVVWEAGHCPGGTMILKRMAKAN